jgi:DNA-binding NtrC family response regulator
VVLLATVPDKTEKVQSIGKSAMKDSAEIRTGNTTITVLSVSPTQDDHDVLERLLNRSKWQIRKALTFSSAVALLQETQISVVVCERDLLPGTWKDMLDHLTLLPQPPHLIVTSRLADDCLWAEALNVGAYDVLAKPFDRTEVLRSVSLACLHWNDQRHEAAIQ